MYNIVIPAGMTVTLAGGATVSLAAGSTVSAITVQGATLLNAAPTVSPANTAATVSLAGAAGQRITIRGIYVKATGAAATATVLVQDGGTTILDLGTISVPLAGATVSFVGNPLVTGTTGNSMAVLVGAGGALSVTTTSVIADRQ